MEESFKVYYWTKHVATDTIMSHKHYDILKYFFVTE